MNQSLQLNIPMSLFAAPTMPQRQDSVSTLGSCQSSASTVSTQDSYRSSNSSMHQPKDFYRFPGADLTRKADSYKSLESVHEDHEVHFASPESVVPRKQSHQEEIRLGPLDHFYGPSDESSAGTRRSSKKQLDSVYVPPTLVHAAAAATRFKQAKGGSFIRQEVQLMSQTEPRSTCLLQPGKSPSAEVEEGVPSPSLLVQ
jgi:hypothetical protein